MSKVPSLSYSQIIAALQRVEKTFDDGTFRITVPVHRPVKRSTLSHIIKQARLTLEDFLKL